MLVIIGYVVVLACVFGGFMLEKGNIMVILEALTNEIIIIAGGVWLYTPDRSAAAFIDYLSGSYSSVVGLPLFETANLLRGLGYAP